MLRTERVDVYGLLVREASATWPVWGVALFLDADLGRLITSLHMASKKSRSSRSSRSTRVRPPRCARDERNLEVSVLLDVARPHRNRKLPQPQTSAHYDKAYTDLASRGLIRWVQARLSLSADHYALTDKGRKAIAVYKDFVTKLGA